MPILPKSAEAIVLPKMVNFKQRFPDECIGDASAASRAALADLDLPTGILPGESVAVLVGSRNISGLSSVVKATIQFLTGLGARPFIVPSMGSHGGGEALAQKAILEGFGVTADAMGAEIRSSMETVIIGKTAQGIPVQIDAHAAKADHIVPVVRIKAHTSFSGPVESGFCKMLSIGIGKHSGCSRLHQEGFESFSELIPEVASLVLEKKSVPFGICVIENAYDHIHSIHAVKGKDILHDEPKLLQQSKSMMPRLCFDHIDVLVIEQIGKDISGTGMDPNITGRSVPGREFYFSGPTITRIVVLDLSETTHGNASGIGRTDFITQKCFDKIDRVATYANCIAAGVPDSARIPIILETEEEALRAAIQTCPKIDPNNARIVRIKDTLHLIDIQVSESLLPIQFIDDVIKEK